ncbi:class I SAM-dependent methyltransferase [Persephonella sp.]
MAKVEPFEEFTERYEEWFEKNRYAYLSELNAVKKLIPEGKGVEIGVGSGRFAVPLNIKYGVEPSLKMAKISKEKGIFVIRAVAEYLPFKDNSFDFCLFVTTICFVDNVDKSIEEAYRILRKEGKIVIGFIDKNSHLGVFYEKIKEKNPFYRYATFYSTEELTQILSQKGFGNFRYLQTVFKKLDEIKSVEPVKEGYGEGSFIVISAEKL